MINTRVRRPTHRISAYYKTQEFKSARWYIIQLTFYSCSEKIIIYGNTYAVHLFAIKVIQKSSTLKFQNWYLLYVYLLGNQNQRGENTYLTRYNLGWKIYRHLNNIKAYELIVQIEMAASYYATCRRRQRTSGFKIQVYW